MPHKIASVPRRQTRYEDLEEADYWQQQDQWPYFGLARASGPCAAWEEGLGRTQEQVKGAETPGCLRRPAKRRTGESVGSFCGRQPRLERRGPGLRQGVRRPWPGCHGARRGGNCRAHSTLRRPWPAGGGPGPLGLRREVVFPGANWRAAPLYIARLADDHSWRQKLRKPAAAKDLDTLKRLAEEDGVLAQPPVNLLLLCYLLDRLPGTPGPWSPAEKATREKALRAILQLLRKAQERYPADFWLNLELGWRLSEQAATLADAVGYLRAALAVQPRRS